MINKSKYVAFLFGLSSRTYPILSTMPFGLNVIKNLDKKGYKIDVFLTEYTNDTLSHTFSKNVRIHFLDHKLLWFREGRINYYLLRTYFRFLILFTHNRKYSYIFGSGSVGISLAAMLKGMNSTSSLIYLNDEFPDSGLIEVWKRAEKAGALKADLVCVPDDCRFNPLCDQIEGLDSKQHFELVNAPLKKDLENLPERDWHAYFGLAKEKKLFISAGGISDTYQVSELLISLKDWPDDCVLILKGKTKIQLITRSFDHIESMDKVIWNSENFKPDDLHSLIKYCTASICLYRNVDDNILFMGKSSGKLMRSVALGRPVIASAFNSLSFVEEMQLGKLVQHPSEIHLAVKFILDNEQRLAKNCAEKYDQISFERGWAEFSKAVKIDDSFSE
jgi:hypothetical protein